MKLNKKIFIITLLLSLLTVVVLYKYINGLKTETIAPVVKMEVVTALYTIPSNTKITAGMLTSIPLPSEAILSDAILDSDKIVGRITNSDIKKGEQVLASRLMEEGAKTSLSYQIPEGKRAITITNTEISGVAGYILPKDRVDILVMYSIKENPTIIYTQFQNIEILKVGSNITKPDASTVPTSLTILVTPEQAEVVMYALNNGSLQLTLRNPDDEKKIDLDGFGEDNFNSWRAR